jgi:hypothetical protein
LFSSPPPTPTHSPLPFSPIPFPFPPFMNLQWISPFPESLTQEALQVGTHTHTHIWPVSTNVSAQESQMKPWYLIYLPLFSVQKDVVVPCIFFCHTTKYTTLLLLPLTSPWFWYPSIISKEFCKSLLAYHCWSQSKPDCMYVCT